MNKRIILIILGIFLIPTSIFALPTDLNYSLESYYTYESNYDDSESFRHGSGSGTSLVPALIGNGASQPFGAEVTVSKRPIITAGSTQTWVQFSSTYSAGASMVRWQQANEGGSYNGDFGFLWGQGGTGGLYWNNEQASGNFESIQQSWTAATWYHIVMTWNSTASERKIYIDGVLDNSDSSTFPGLWADTANQHNELMDINSWANTVLWDEQAIWNGKVLTAAEVVLLYNSGVGCSYTALNDGSCAGGGGGSAGNGTNNVIGAPAGFNYNFTYNTDSQFIIYNWSDSFGTMNSSKLDIYYFNNSAYILDQSITNLSNPGQITINISNLVNQNLTIRGLAYLTDSSRTFLSGNTTLIDTLWVYPARPINYTTYTIDQPEGVFWGMGILMTMILMAAYNPPVAIMLGVSGLWFISLFGFIELATSTLFTITLMAAILIWGMKRR